MKWSSPKEDPLTRKWYRLHEAPNGDKEMLISQTQWGICKGLAEDSDTTFEHCFQRSGKWFQHTDIAYKYLFLSPEGLTELGYLLEPQEPDNRLDELFTRIQPLENWATYLEERLNDSHMAIQYANSHLQEQFAEPNGKGKKHIPNELTHLQELEAAHTQWRERLLAEEGITGSDLAGEIARDWITRLKKLLAR